MKMMRRYMLSVMASALLLMLAPMSGSAAPGGATAAAAYNEAGSLYRAGKFQDALERYEQLIQSGIRNPDLYYNASNAAYRLNRFGKAVLYLERARKLAPSDRDVLTNLAFINSRKQDKESVERNAVTAFLAGRYDAINVNSAALWSGAAFALMLLFGAGIIFFARWKRTAFLVLAAGCGFAFILSTGILIQKTHRNATVEEAVIMDAEVNAYSGPGTENTHIFTLHEGTTVQLERSQDAWALIRLKSGIGGWVTAGSLGSI